MSRNIKRIGAILALTMTLAFAGSANAGLLGFELGMNADGGLAIENNSIGTYSIIGVTIDFMYGSPSNTTYFDTAGPGSTGFSNDGGYTAILPDNVATDGAQSAMFTFSYSPSISFTTGLFSELGFDLDQAGDETGSPFGAKVTVSYYSSLLSKTETVWGLLTNMGTTINGQTYQHTAIGTATVTPVPPTLLLLASGLLGIFGYRRMRG